MNIRIPEQNHVIIAGRLTRDPEHRVTQKGSGVCFFDVAVNRRYKDAVTGEWKDDVTYVPVTVWGPMGDRCKEKLQKGSPVHVEGRLAGSEYLDKTGQKRKVLKVTARRVQFLATASAAPEAPDAGETAETEEQPGPQARESSSGIEEVPF